MPARLSTSLTHICPSLVLLVNLSYRFLVQHVLMHIDLTGSRASKRGNVRGTTKNERGLSPSISPSPLSVSHPFSHAPFSRSSSQRLLQLFVVCVSSCVCCVCLSVRVRVYIRQKKLQNVHGTWMGGRRRSRNLSSSTLQHKRMFQYSKSVYLRVSFLYFLVSTPCSILLRQEI